MYWIIKMYRYSILAFLVFLTKGDAHVGSYGLKVTRNTALFNSTFLNLTHVANVDQCFAMCLQHCRCLSFQICHNDLCQLCSTTKNLTPSALRETDECVYYDFRRDFMRELSHGHCEEDSLPTETSCCLTSNPCQNDGVCEPERPTCQPRRRFRCKCQPGYTGELCEKPIMSCRGYQNGNRVAGKYKVFDANMIPFEVFCDFDPEPGKAWTLIQSYQLQYIVKVRRKDFGQNFPLNEDNPVWDLYRLSRSRMLSIQQDSSKWRMTCRYDTDGLSYTDHVVGAKNVTDILTLDGGGYPKLEYINIRGYSCSDCTALVAQVKDWTALHMDSYYTARSEECSFKPQDSLPCGSSGEDNFGCYSCINPAHRCSATQESTSQTWLGGI